MKYLRRAPRWSHGVPVCSGFVTVAAGWHRFTNSRVSRDLQEEEPLILAAARHLRFPYSARGLCGSAHEPTSDGM